MPNLKIIIFLGGPPRFKQNVRLNVYSYLGDNVKFKCSAIGRPPPKVHWYREGTYLNYSYMQNHPRFKEKSMSLEVRQVEVSDKVNYFIFNKILFMRKYLKNSTFYQYKKIKIFF